MENKLIFIYGKVRVILPDTKENRELVEMWKKRYGRI